MSAPLLERESQLAELTGLVQDARTGRGGVVLVEGEAGIGKTALLNALTEAADDGATTLLRAAGGQLEGDTPFGVVRELFAPALQGDRRTELLRGPAALCERVFGGGGGPAQDPDAVGAVLHGLHWLTVNLAEAGPLVLVVDDVQWCDAPSARFLNYLVARLADLPCLVVLASRPASAARETDALRDAPGVLRRTLPPLSVASVGAIVSDTLGGPVDAVFAAACRRAAGGNAFLIHSLADELAARGVRGSAVEIADLDAVGAGQVGVAVRRRLAGAGPDATAIARAVAVLGPSASYRLACALAGVPDADGESGVALLVAERLLVDTRPLTFVHPLLRTAVYDALAPGERARWHARAAALLADAGDREAAAHHLRLAEPLGDQRAVAILREAAARGIERGAPDVAVVYLQRALEEPAGPEHRVGVLSDLATAEMHLGLMPAALGHLEEAVTAASDPMQRAVVALQHAMVVQWTVDTSRGAQMVADLADSLPPGAREHAIGALLVTSSGSAASRVPSAGALEELRARTDFGPEEQHLVAILALELAATGGPADQALALATRALSTDDLLRQQNQLLAPTHELAAMAATCAGAPALGIDGLTRAAAYAQERGSAASFARATTMRGWSYLRLGELAEAEADLRGVVDIPGARLMNPVLHMATVGALAQTVLHRQGVAEARAALTEFDDGTEDPRAAPDQQLLLARALVALAERDARAALDQLEVCRVFEQDFGGACPSYVPWRPIAVDAQLLLGDRDAARALAGEHRVRAEAFGSAEVIGVAVHSAGLVDRDIDLLRQAADLLEGSSAHLDHARALLDLGAALRSRRHAVEARGPLTQAMDAAARCGAAPLVARAREELLAAGARPRRARTRGADSLTPTEQRIARLASEGLTNRQIAEAGFISPRTVAMHLSNSYRKLGVTSRQELAAAAISAP